MQKWACTDCEIRSSGPGYCCKQSSGTGPETSDEPHTCKSRIVSLSSGNLSSCPLSTCMPPASALQKTTALQAGRQASSAQKLNACVSSLRNRLTTPDPRGCCQGPQWLGMCAAKGCMPVEHSARLKHCISHSQLVTLCTPSSADYTLWQAGPQVAVSSPACSSTSATASLPVSSAGCAASSITFWNHSLYLPRGPCLTEYHRDRCSRSAAWGARFYVCCRDCISAVQAKTEGAWVFSQYVLTRWMSTYI